MKIKLNNIFYSIQGEGRYVGYPVMFIRLAGCNLRCGFCDTNYSFKFEMSIKQLLKKIKNYRGKYVVFTGGEPLLQKEQLFLLCNYSIFSCRDVKYHLESNGILFTDSNINEYSFLRKMFNEHFNYLCFSPKDLETAMKLYEIKKLTDLSKMMDIKIVTDGKKLNRNMIKYATMLMPLTTFDNEKDLQIKQNVWKLCQLYHKIYSPRLHIDLFNKKKGV